MNATLSNLSIAIKTVKTLAKMPSKRKGAAAEENEVVSSPNKTKGKEAEEGYVEFYRRLATKALDAIRDHFNMVQTQFFNCGSKSTVNEEVRAVAQYIGMLQKHLPWCSNWKMLKRRRTRKERKIRR